MFTTLLTVGLAVILAVAFGLALRVRQRAADLDGQQMERRFGPEYERVLAARNGDARAARRELAARLRRYGSLEVLPLASGARERYLAQWKAVQEEFAESPATALREAEALLTRLAGERGYPADAPFEERVAALSVHHARRVQGYLRVHDALHSDGGGSTQSAAHAGNAADAEDVRGALLEARALFDSLLNARPCNGAGQQRERTVRAARPRLGLPGNTATGVR
ncbi:hypothetical protein ITI46_17985 [Streptomyces oryzae]|uniref:Secreted protein n=1 Tax=Streptomyces oryzae TaxID=1434886 RepID=A0ABS3XDR8_9ACTN|nr:hypothetical protein [Streptomyces oryzae]MBO8193534.1 hypothetical protein [Streptomyces oryzae]